RHKDMIDNVVGLGGRALSARSSAPLRAIDRHRCALDVTRMRYGYRHIFVGDQVLERELGARFDDLSPSFVAVFLMNLSKLLDDEIAQHGLVREYFLKLRDELNDLFVFIDQLLAFETGELLELHFEYGARLQLAELEALHQRLASFGRTLGFANQRDHRVQIVERLLQALQNVGA